MNTYIYDGSFDGLLTVIYDSYYSKEIPNRIIRDGCIEGDFLVNYINIQTNDDKAIKVYNAIREKISQEALNNIYYAFLSEESGFEMIIYNYIRLGFKVGNTIDQYLTKDIVSSLHNLVRKVRREQHRMLGLIRFMELNRGILYAKIQPKYNILSLVSPHFAKRLGRESWVIHDTNRGILSVYYDGQWYISETTLQGNLEINDREQIFQSLWQVFFENISIKERKNIKLQQRNMPKRYWSNLIEKNIN